MAIELPSPPTPVGDATAELGDSIVLMVPRESTTAASVGDVEVVGDIPHVVRRHIAENEIGTFARRGGTYYCKRASSTGVINTGTKIYWNPGNGAATSGAFKHFGYSTRAAADGDTHVMVEHNPDGSQGT